IRGWWANPHYERPGGVRSATPTSWQPRSKPIWLTELGCPAIDMGTNQPNVFYDPKSSESALPYYSKGIRDDLIQRLYHEAMLDYWQTHAPVSSVYGGPMLEPANMFAWTWDARPYPDFPLRTSVWRDGPNWRLGHWLPGRLGLVTLADVVRDLTKGLGVPVDVSGLSGLVTGFVIERIMSARDALEPLMMAYAFDGFESEGVIRFRHRGSAPVMTLQPGDLIAPDDDTRSTFTITRAQESELPGSVKLRAIDGDGDYQQQAVEAKRLKGQSVRVSETTLAVVMDRGQAQGIADRLLIDAHVMRERAEFVCAPSALNLDPGDVVALQASGRTYDLRLEAIGYEHVRPAKAVRTDASVYDRTAGPVATPEPVAATEAGKPLLEILDLPLLRGDEAPHAPLLAAYASPWNGVAVYRSPGSSGFVLDSTIENPATIGRLVAPLDPGPTSRWDRANEIIVELPSTETLESRDRLLVLGGANLGAVKNAEGHWEVVQWQNAELVGSSQYRLSLLLRGQAGTEAAMGDPTPIGSTFAVIDPSLVQSSLAPSERGLAFTWKWGPAIKPIDDPTWQAMTASIAGIGLRPLSPVHLKARKDPATGDIHLSWIRRTRIGGDNWQAPDVPLGEERELYEVDIHDGTDMKRTLSSATPTAIYTAAMQAGDFGGPVTTLDWSVRQMSSTFGRGMERRNSSDL
ncbi:MAG TPA: hypothetical protein ENI90_03785, partial [Methylothermaceae bacterium]|nr:hypothetical protein [Methylothermaceae bacterium]